jgi:hypothetical protein
VLFESLFNESERDGVFKTEHQGSFTFIYGDASVIVSFAGQFTDTIVATRGRCGDAPTHFEGNHRKDPAVERVGCANSVNL